MRISVFGLGYVGCVSAACLAHDGHDVIGVDVNPQKVAMVGAGRSPIVEPGLDDLVQEGVRAGRLSTTTSARDAVADTDISLICVGTPSNGNGSLSLQYVDNVCRDIGNALSMKRSYHVVVVRSTVLPGTSVQRLIPVLEEYSGRAAGEDFGMAMNPEFLREGNAIHDYYHPSQIVIGELDTRSGDATEALYDGIEAAVVRTTIETAETVKYASNAFHATKVAFANEIGRVCKAHGVDGYEVMNILCQDRRLNISPAYLKPGFAFGGSCLPKDLRALLYRAKESDLTLPLLAGALQSNQEQIQRGIEMVERTGKKRVGVVGLSFKSGTDDVRESAVVPLIETLAGRGYEVEVYDEIVDPSRLVGANRSYLERELPHIVSMLQPSVEALVEAVEVVVVATTGQAARRAAALLRDDQILLDLVGGVRDARPTRGRYDGIGW
ncbi:MAG: UDP-glucose/GDP-mannose dehydrogenase family protein [Sphaerobacter sp.]|nr:UDP-glucose/GDP-mannose dehydrogenase family protein [Sphaerobacter sp.]